MNNGDRQYVSHGVDMHKLMVFFTAAIQSLSQFLPPVGVFIIWLIWRALPVSSGLD